MKLIDGDLLIEALHGIRTEFVKHPTFLRSDIEEGIDRGVSAAMQAINDASTIDAVPVVRCKDCKHYDGDNCCMKNGLIVRDDGGWFCADGERRSENE